MTDVRLVDAVVNAIGDGRADKGLQPCVGASGAAGERRQIAVAKSLRRVEPPRHKRANGGHRGRTFVHRPGVSMLNREAHAKHVQRKCFKL